MSLKYTHIQLLENNLTPHNLENFIKMVSITRNVLNLFGFDNNNFGEGKGKIIRSTSF